MGSLIVKTEHEDIFNPPARPQANYSEEEKRIIGGCFTYTLNERWARVSVE
jgi:hypothetical protein